MRVVICKGWRAVHAAQLAAPLRRKSTLLHWAQPANRADAANVAFFLSRHRLVGICPETDPKLTGLNSISQVEKNLNVDYPSCGPYMQTFDCVSDLGFQLDGVTTYLRPDDAYKTGTATLSNGGGTVTAPASGAVFTYTNGGDGQVYTITAYGFDGKENKGSSDSGSGSESGSDSGSSSESQSDAKGASASASGDSKKGDDKEDTGSLTSDMHVELLVASIMFAVVCLS